MSQPPKGTANPNPRPGRTGTRSVSATARLPSEGVPPSSLAVPRAPIPAAETSSSPPDQRGHQRTISEELVDTSIAVGQPPPRSSLRPTAEDEEDEPQQSGSEDSSLSVGQVQSMLRISEARASTDLRKALQDADRRHQQLAADIERRHDDKMDRIMTLLGQLQQAPTVPSRTPSTPTAGDHRRAPRVSAASNMVFGAEDTPRGPIPPHLRFAEPAPPADRAPAVGAAIRMEDEEEEAEPRHNSRSFFRAKSKDIGTFNPEQGDDIYSWWSGLVTYMECSRYTEAEMFAGLPGCFEGSSRHWFNTLKPRPRTLEELRVRAFSAYVRNESQVWEELDDHRFKPERERLDVYLADKLKLISELHVSRAVNRGSLSLEPFSLDSIMTTQTVSDAIQTAHQGLPPDWAILLDSSREAAQDWTDYRTRLLGKERGTRTAIALLQRPASSPVPSINSPRARPARTHAAAPREFDNTQSARPRAPSMSPVDEETRRLDREQGRCFACHTAGHAKSNCPSRASTVRVIKRILARLEDDNDEEDEHFSMVVRQVAVLQARQRHTDADSASETDPEDNVARVRYARSVSVLADEPSPPSFGISPPTERDVDLKGHRHRDVVAHKAAVYLENENERLELHVDGGSPLSMITPRALRTIAPDAKILPPEPLKIRGYRGDDFQRPSGVTLLPVSFPTANGVPAVIHHFEFHVVEECTGGWILGVDNMKADGIDALSKRELLVFESRPDAEVRLLQTSSEARHVGSPSRLVCAKKVRIEPHTVRVVEIDPVASDLVVRPWWFSHEESPTGFVKVPCCLVGVDTRGVEVTNTSEAAVDLEEGDVLGEVEPLLQQLCDLSELEDEVNNRPKGRLGHQKWDLSRSLKSWRRSTAASPPSELKTSRRVTFTRTEDDGNEVLPEIDTSTPEDRQQTVLCSAGLTVDQRSRLMKVLESHAVWSTPLRPLGLYEYGEVSLRLREGQDHWTHTEPPRRTSPAQKDVIDDTLREHDDLGISEPSQGSYASGVVLVQQRDKIRFCNDYRPLNKVTVDDYYAMPTVDAIFDQLGQSKVFTVVDANKGYYQFLLSKDSRDLTGFITFRGLRRYRRMPFGLKQAPSWFQRAMDRILGAARWQFALAYLDDVVVYSNTFEEHLIHLDTVLAALERAGLTISPSKCRFAFESVALLGYKVHSLGLMTDEDKTRAVLDFPEPTNAAEARRFFAMSAWYRRFIKDFAARAQPINKSFVGPTFVWHAAERAAFEDLKTAITTAPVLARPDFRRPFVLAVDASKQGLGGVLLQTDANEEERPLLYISRQTTDGEKRYAPTHLELAAVWWCVKKLHHYIDGSSLEVRTDHNALKWLWDLKPSEMHETRVQKFKMALAPLENKVKISYHRGKDNVVADALSRAPIPDQSHADKEATLSFTAREYQRLPEIDMAAAADKIIRSISVLRFGAEELGLWAAAYAADPHWRRIWRRSETRGTAVAALPADIEDEEVGEEEDRGVEVIVDDDKPSTAVDLEAADPPARPTAPPRRELRPRRILAVHRAEENSIFFIKDGLLYVQTDETVRLCVPKARLDLLIHEYHRSIRAAHPSAERTHSMMKDHIFAHGLAQHIATHVRTCYECQANKVPRHKPYGELQPIVTQNEVFHTLGMDFITGVPKTELGHDSILNVVCKYSRYAFFIPGCTTDTAEQVATRFLNHVYPVSGVPKAIISDRDTRFTSAFWSRLLASLDIKMAMSTAFHPQTDGLVERINGQLETMLRHYVAIDQHDWDTKLPSLAMAYNSQRSTSTTFSPYRLVFNREPSVFPLRDLVDAADTTSAKVNDIFAVHADAQAAMDIARERQRSAYNSRHQPQEFAVGDALMISLKNYKFDLDPTENARAKLAARQGGPYKVKRRIGRLAYELDVPEWFRAHPVLPISALEPFHGDPEEFHPRAQAGVAGGDGGDELRVRDFLGRRPTQLLEGITFDYLVKWAGPKPTWQCDSRLPVLAWATKKFERLAREQLHLTRLSRDSSRNDHFAGGTRAGRRSSCGGQRRRRKDAGLFVGGGECNKLSMTTRRSPST